MENINDCVCEMNELEEQLSNLNINNKKYDKIIKKLNIMKGFGIGCGLLLIPYITYFIKVADLTIISNAYLLAVGVLALGSLSYSFVIESLKSIKYVRENQTLCEEKIIKTKKLLNELTIKHDNCLTNELEKKNIISLENNFVYEVENTNKKDKVYTKTLKKDK